MAISRDLLYCAVVGILLSTIIIFSLNKSQLDFVYTYVPISSRGRRISTSKTPPRSLSPEKKMPTDIPPSVDYKEMFPPSRREALAKAAETLSRYQKGKLRGLKIDDTIFRRGIIPFTADYRECGPLTYTPMEISIEEIKALGDFPDYAELSGVPLPEAYKTFNIDTAIARPYRPFRWAYHQTMCTSFVAGRG